MPWRPRVSLNNSRLPHLAQNELLSPEAARGYRLLSLNPATDFSMPAAASLLRRNATQTERILRELVRSNMLEQPSPGRLRYHDLVALHVVGLAERLDPAVEQQAARQRLTDHYLQTAHGAVLQMYPLAVPISIANPADGVAPEQLNGYTASFAWFDREREALPLIIRLAADIGEPGQAWKLAWTCQDYFRRRGYWRE